MADEVQRSLDYYSREKNKMLEDARQNQIMFAYMDKMWQNKLDLPPELTSIEGFHQVTPTEPSDSIQTSRRLLSTVEPKPTYHPLDSDIATRERANVIEKSLTWHYKQADTRSDGDNTGDIAQSALMYDKVDVFVEHIPWQDKLSGVKNDDSWGAAGDFAISVYHPGAVTTKRTSRGLQVVLLSTNQSPEEVIERWGDKAEKIIKDYAQEKGKDAELPDSVVYCDRWDKKDRIVWLEFDNGGGNIQEKNVILKEPHGMPFIPWSCRTGGRQLRPLLTSIFQAKSWETVAIMESLLVTEAIKTGAAPLTYSNTNDGKSPKIDYTIVGGNVALKLNEKITPMQKPQIDNRLTELTDRVQSRMGASTLPRVLGDPSLASGQAFATFNAELRQASNVLDPAKKLSQRVISDIYTLMLQWLIFTKEPLYAYDWDDKKSETYGNQTMVDPQEISPTDIYIDIELQAKLPLDKVSELNAASLFVDKFGASREDALEMVQVTDAKEMLERGAQEQMTMAEIQKTLMVIEAEGQAAAKDILDTQALETQKKQMEMQMQAQSAQMQQQQGMQQQAQQQAPAEQAPPEQQQGELAMAQQQATARAAANIPPDQAASELAQLTGNMQGAPFDPSQGGQSPSGALPGELTREKKTKRTRGGTPIEGA